MNFKDLPTDNLYKFSAISGLLILIFSFVFPQIKIYELRVEVIQLHTALKILNLETDKAANQISLLETRVKKNDLQKNSQSGEHRKINDAALDNISASLSSVEDDLFQLRVKRFRIDGDIDRVQILKDMIDVYLKFQFIGMFCGVALTLIGFWCWYFRVQKFLDLKVKTDGKIERRKVGYLKP